MEDLIRLEAPAKVNLFLEVTGKRPDGYHDIVSVMQTVSLSDTVTVLRAEQITVSSSGTSVPSGDGNIAYTAALRFFEAKRLTGGAHIEIEKRIPVCAGLGGGSADAAATLRALNRLFGEPYTREELLKLGATVGADVPFCIVGGTARVHGIGDGITPVETSPTLHFVIAKDGEKTSTGEQYRALDAYGTRHVHSPDGLLAAIAAGDEKGIGRELYNAFSLVGREGRVEPLLRKAGALGVCVCGSGPSVFGLFECEGDARRACDALRADGIEGYVAASVSALQGG